MRFMRSLKNSPWRKMERVVAVTIANEKAMIKKFYKFDDVVCLTTND